MQFYIMAQFDDLQPEIVDTTPSRKEAEYLAGEYQLAYGAQCRVWTEPSAPTEQESADYLIAKYLKN